MATAVPSLVERVLPVLRRYGARRTRMRASARSSPTATKASIAGSYSLGVTGAGQATAISRQPWSSSS